MANFTGLVGTMGAGTTSFATSLGNEFGWQVYLEPVDKNPFLGRFYDDKKRWALHSQLRFFIEASRQGREIQKDLSGKRHCIEDRILAEHEMFARMQFETGSIDRETFELYCDTADLVRDLVPTPDLVIFLDVSPETAMRRIAQRGREEEAGVEIEYLKKLDIQYSRLIAKLKNMGTNVLTLDWNEERMPDALVTQQVKDAITQSMFNSNSQNVMT